MNFMGLLPAVVLLSFTVEDIHMTLTGIGLSSTEFKSYRRTVKVRCRSLMEPLRLQMKI
jgi:hypothetical protein